MFLCTRIETDKHQFYNLVSDQVIHSLPFVRIHSLGENLESVFE
jgi:hypothetical protein